jgi:hypothetical protein
MLNYQRVPTQLPVTVVAKPVIRRIPEGPCRLCAGRQAQRGANRGHDVSARRLVLSAGVHQQNVGSSRAKMPAKIGNEPAKMSD